MITSEFARTMARYNAWQNRSLMTAAATLSEDERKAECGVFWGSIHATLSHLMWGDVMWMSRFDGWEKPDVGLADSGVWLSDWDALSKRRLDADARISQWAEGLTDAALTTDLSWYSGAARANVTKPFVLCITHFFNHQTHHRGQVHALLTAAGATPEDTDLFLMPSGG